MVAFAWRRDGKAATVVRLWNIAEFYGGEKQRPRFDYYHFASDRLGFIELSGFIPTQWPESEIPANYKKTLNRGHEQLDTIGWFLFLCFVSLTHRADRLKGDSTSALGDKSKQQNRIHIPSRI